MDRKSESSKNHKFRKIAKWTPDDFNKMLKEVVELIPDESEMKSVEDHFAIKENMAKVLKNYGEVLDDDSVKELLAIVNEADIDEVYDRIENWYHDIMNPQPQPLMQTLRGYQNSNPDFMKPGIIIGYEGRHFDINNLTPEDFSRETQARCLSRESRYCGNTRLPYSVAQHCVVGAEVFLLMGRPDLARIFIRHEGAETILRDMTKPVKDMLPDYEALQAKLDRYNAEVHGLPYPFPPEIKVLDKNCAQYEMTFMMSTHMHTDYWDAGEAEVRFLETWDKIEHIWNTYYKQPA